MRKTYTGIFTIIFFTLLTSTIIPVAAIDNKAKQVTEDFSESPTPKGTVKSASTAPEAITNKILIYKGEVSATPSAIGKFLVKTDSADKNIDTDKNTKVYNYDSGKRAVSAVNKLKVTDKVVVIGNNTADNKSLLANYVMVFNKQPTEKLKSAMYGIVSSREATGSSFTLEVKNPLKDESTHFILNQSTSVSVKDLEYPKLSDIKIGDRVTLVYTTENELNTATRIFAIPGRASGLLREIRESSNAAVATASASPSVKSATTTKPSATPSHSAKMSSKPAVTVKPTQ
jgi:hypothetical protein